MATFRENRLWMKLHAPGGMRGMLESHDEALFGAGCDTEYPGQGFRVRNQGVISPDRERAGKALKQSCPVVTNTRSPAMHRFGGAHHFSPQGCGNGLMAQTDPQNRKLARERLDQRHTYPGFGR